ncbi:hypothetical protein ACVQK1_09225 [Edwardsiella tarda]
MSEITIRASGIYTSCDNGKIEAVITDAVIIPESISEQAAEEIMSSIDIKTIISFIESQGYEVSENGCSRTNPPRLVAVG